MVFDVDGRTVCQLPNDENAPARGRLISSAPALLEALKAELARQFYGDQCGRCGVRAAGHADNCPLAAPSALIARIEGGE